MPFLADQFRDYPLYHADRTNLVVHAVAVPVFDLSWIVFALAAGARSPLVAAASIAVAATAFAAEARGHAGEANPAVPFRGPANALQRIFAEQFITFPRFFLSGGWSRAYRAAVSRR